MRPNRAAFASTVTTLQNWRPRYVLAGVHALRSEPAQALDALRGAVDAGWRDVRRLDVDASFDSLRAEPAFQQLRQDLEARVGEMRRRLDNP